MIIYFFSNLLPNILNVMFKRKKTRGKVLKRKPGVRLLKKRTFNRKKGNNSWPKFRGPGTTIIRQPSGTSDRLFVKLRFREQFSSAQSPGTNLADIVYKGNSPFDPSFTSAVQPYLFSNWAQLYQRYVCFGSKITTYNVMNNATSGPANAMTMISHSPYQAAYVSIYSFETDPYVKRKNVNFGALGVGRNSQSYFCSTAKATNRPKKAVAIEENYSALVTADPATLWYWHLGNYVPGSNDQSLICDVVIDYYVMFYQPIRPT